MPIRLIKKNASRISCDAEVRALLIQSEESIIKSYEEDKLVIFVKAPQWIDGNSGESELLAKCYTDALKIAEENNCKRVVIPLELKEDSFPKNKIYPIAVKAISDYLENSEILVYLCISNIRKFKSGFSLRNKLREYISKVYEPKKEVFISWRSESKTKKGIDFGNSGTPWHSGSGGMRTRARTYKPHMKREISPHARRRVLSRTRKGYIKIPDSVKNRLCNVLDKEPEETFTQMVLRLITEKGMTDPECYKAANMDKRLFSKIRCNINYHPDKETAIALALALELDLEQANLLLKKAGYALSHNDKRDVIIEFFIQENQFNIFEIDGVLLEYGQKLLTKYD